MTEPAIQFHLWQTFAAHGSDVKAVEPTSQGHLATVSRDETAKLWVEKENGYVQEAEFKNGQHVNSLGFYECPDGSSEFIVCGRKDGTVALFAPTSEDPTVVIRVHQMNVCTLRVDSATGRCISGGWDSKAVVTDLNKALQNQPSEIYGLNGHKNSVWAVEFVQNQPNNFVTGSADRTIKLWCGNECIMTLEGHQDVVRSIIMLPNGNLISSANDSTLRVWSTESGKCLEAYDSYHGEFIYATALLTHPSGKKFVISCSERGYVEIYALVADDTALSFLQPVRAPVVSLWAVRSTKDGDFALAASNGFVYIFSANPDKKAPEPVEAAFEAELASFIATEAAAKAAEQNDKVVIKVSLDDSGRQLDLVYVKGQNPIDSAKNFLAVCASFNRSWTIGKKDDWGNRKILFFFDASVELG
uniref:WD_REPEATS_REGION domain-containing protein n=1 Tax=Bursaphelenchus xylophilus TaxID=6326 RepID=A0A1I7SRY2_BURXY